MNYKRIYDELINDAIINPSSEAYKETHHIKPRCCGGTNQPENLVRLTARQHFVAHWLLYKIYRTSKLAHAWFNMCRIGKGQEARLINSRKFEYAKTTRARVLSREMSGNNNRFFGKKHSLETREKMSKIQRKLRNWEKFTDQHKFNLLESQRRKKTAEHKRKIGANKKGFIVVQHVETKQIVRIDRNCDPRAQDPNWVNPKKIKPDKKQKCQYCKIETSGTNIKRWHNEKCKHKTAQKK